MLTLSIETSAITASVALCSNGDILKYKMVNDGKTHSEVLMPLIEEVMDGHSCDELNRIALSNGPGSFTGIRIGVATVKGIAFKNKINCIPVSSLEAAAYNFANTKSLICSAMDARRGQFYTALFKANGTNVKRLTEDMALKSDEIEKELHQYDESEIILVGDGAKKLYSMINIKNTNVPDGDLMYQNAIGVELASREKTSVSPENVMPFYLRPSSAEQNIRMKKN